jgi:hypothetical protein
MHRLEEAEEQALKSANMLEALGSKQFAFGLINLSHFYAKQERFEESKKYGQKALCELLAKPGEHST